MRGKVVDFDEHAGFGTVRSEEEGKEFSFHCTRIVGGTRTIALGAAVDFVVVPGQRGRWEASRVTER